MKKCTALVLAFLLLVSNIGFAFNVHYCGGKIAGFSSIYTIEEVCKTVDNNDKTCCAKPSDDDKGCCKNKKVQLQDKSDDIIIKSFSFNPGTPFIGLSETHCYIIPEFIIKEVILEFNYYSDSNGPPLFKLYSQYILYA